MAFKVPPLRSLHLIQDDETKQCWIPLDDIYTFVKTTSHPADTVKLGKKAHLLSLFKADSKSVKIDGSTQLVTADAFIGFVFGHSNKRFACGQLARQFTAKLLTAECEAHGSHKELYDAIAAESLRDNKFETYAFKNTKWDGICPRKLETTLKDRYNPSQWQRIVFFEHHFERQNDVPIDYDNLINAKWDFFRNLQATRKSSLALEKLNKAIVIDRRKRRNIAESENGVYLSVGGIKHVPGVVDDELLEEINTYVKDPFLSVISLDCWKWCKHQPGLHIYLVCADDQGPFEQETVLLITSFLTKYHDVTCMEVSLIYNKSLEDFVNEQGTLQRFRFQDSVRQGKVYCNVIFGPSIEAGYEYTVFSELRKCTSCYGSSLTKPLSISNFDLVTEWILDVPVDIQVLCEPYINGNSLLRVKEKDIPSFITPRLHKLYNVQDILLGVNNRNYVGIIQSKNTHELTMGNKSTSHIFNVTSKAGISQSLCQADRILSSMSQEDKCFFNTYKRKHKLHYKSLFGDRDALISIQDCSIKVLLLDNLVRLTHATDPSPGQGKTKQMCTLPITIKGVPDDSAEIANWHDRALCDSSDRCPCKESRQLKPSDIDALILTLLPVERIAIDRFDRLMTWGMNMVWTNCESRHPELWKLLTQKPTDDDKDIAELDVSFINMSIESNYDEEGIGSIFDKSGQNLEIQISGSNYTNQANDDVTSTGDQLLNSEISGINYENQADDDVTSTGGDQLLNSEIPVVAEEDDSETEEEIGDVFRNEQISLDLESSVHPLPLSPESVDTTDNITMSTQTVSSLTELKYAKYVGPDQVVKHPPPATGKDDDIVKLKEILDDVIVKSQHSGNDVILFAPDHKIAKNLFQLRKQSDKYESVIPEFPVLHLRKSKINNLFSAYKEAGILQLIMFMRDEDTTDWTKLVSVHHIDQATKYIKRLAIALQMAITASFSMSLDNNVKNQLISELQNSSITKNSSDWENRYKVYVEQQKQINPQFTLHCEMMEHCKEVVAISFAERLGGHDGYNLLLGTVKESLPFSFLNGAISYAPFCTQLLHDHYKCGPFYRNMKACLFTSPVKKSGLNFGLDTQREIEHLEALKSFRSGSSLTAVLPRMSLIDMFTDTQITENMQTRSIEQDLSMVLTEKDLQHIFRAAYIILHRGALAGQNEDFVNEYTVNKVSLSQILLDTKSYECGKYLVKKFSCKEGLFKMESDELPNPDTLGCSKSLIEKVKGKSTTIKRANIKEKQSTKSTKEKQEDTRLKTVQREKKKVECLSSAMNACQAIVRPDCSKPNVNKSKGIQNALLSLAVDCYRKTENALDTDHAECADILEKRGTILLNKTSFPKSIVDKCVALTIEFAGIKFKANSSTGAGYLQYCNKGVLQKLLGVMPNVHHVAISEEKYSFTADELKAQTRKERAKTTQTISHLKHPTDFLSIQKFDKSLLQSLDGKMVLSNFLTQHRQTVNPKKDVIIDFDSECFRRKCNCQKNICNCNDKKQVYSAPIRCQYNKTGYLDERPLNIKQRKGEAEMAQVDWVFEYGAIVKPGEIIVSVVSSGDIDALIIHLFALPKIWERDESGKFTKRVYVLLQKKGSTHDLYCITDLIELFERVYHRNITMSFAVLLSLGGNDYLPKFHGITHEKMVFASLQYIDKLFTLHFEGSICTSMEIDSNVFCRILKELYCPKRLQSCKLSYEEVRQITVQYPGSSKIRNPQLWLLPQSSVEKLSQLANCFIQYLLTAGDHAAILPDFLSVGCLRKLSNGDIEYNLGEECNVKRAEDLLKIPTHVLKEKLIQARNTNTSSATKRAADFTPRKERQKLLKGGPVTSTPKRL